MALSNIRKEPRREITESVIGTIAAAVYLVGCYLTATRVFGAQQVTDKVYCTVIFAAVAWLVIPGTLVFTHFVGEIVCDAMAAIRIDPRPRQRY